MFIELVDQLRCVRPHEDSWLVAAVERMADRDVVDGVLGCPICNAAYPVRDRAVLFSAPDETAPGRTESVDPAEVLRAAALLGLGDPGGFVLLCGEQGSLARPLLALVQVQLVVLNPIGRTRSGDGVSVIHAPPGSLPLAAGSLRAVALDERAVMQQLVGPATRALRDRGRIVAPAGSPLPADVVELARDEREWVGEHTGAVSAPVRLAVARGGPRSGRGGP